jgi:hypothetical protein
MNVWYAIPTTNPPHAREHLARWLAMGYRVALLVDGDADTAGLRADLIFRRSDWTGYPAACNWLYSQLAALDPTWQVIVGGGDDMDPDPRKGAEEIAGEFLQHFPDTLGVMQPTGDDWMPDRSGVVAAARICGSPWLGRRFVQSAYRGNGPYWGGYFHFFYDEELKLVAEAAGVLWQRPDLAQRHDHWTRRHVMRPLYLLKAQDGWASDKRLFEERLAAGWPGWSTDWSERR